MEPHRQFPFMPKGTKIRYKGDLICEAVRDCFSGDPMSVEDFTWYVDKPSLGDEIHPAIMIWCALRVNQIKRKGMPKVHMVDYDEGR